MLSENPTFEELNDWKTSIVDYLEILPGYQEGILNIRPNFEEVPDEQLK